MSDRPTRGRVAPTVAETLSRIGRDVASVRDDIRPLRSFLVNRAPGTAWRALDVTDPPDISRGETRGTREPGSQIARVTAQIEDPNDPAAAPQIIAAIAADVEGAMTDIRSIKNLIESVLDDPDEKERFRALFKRKRP